MQTHTIPRTPRAKASAPTNAPPPPRGRELDLSAIRGARVAAAALEAAHAKFKRTSTHGNTAGELVVEATYAILGALLVIIGRWGTPDAVHAGRVITRIAARLLRNMASTTDEPSDSTPAGATRHELTAGTCANVERAIVHVRRCIDDLSLAALDACEPTGRQAIGAHPEVIRARAVEACHYLRAAEHGIDDVRAAARPLRVTFYETSGDRIETWGDEQAPEAPVLVPWTDDPAKLARRVSVAVNVAPRSEVRA
jgi:hypothetical protein